MELFLRYWGKSAGAVDGGPVAHRLVYHALDVAAVGATWWAADQGLRARVASLLGLREAEARALILWLLVLHDLGKFAGSFQALSEAGARAVDARLPKTIVRDTRHDSWSAEFAEAILLKAASDATMVLFGVVAGHHGRPAAPPTAPGRGYDAGDLAAAEGFANACPGAMAIDVSTVLMAFDDVPRAQRASWLIAGLAVVCDWIGSNTRWFPYMLEQVPMADYWRDVALPRAGVAIAAAGIVPARFATECPAVDLLPPGRVPTPLQDAVETLALGDGPQLHVIEDLTGAGKTEASMILARRLIAAGRGSGIFIALPTQATANAMWRRIGALRSRLVIPGDTPTVVLAHGARELALRTMAPGPSERGAIPQAHEVTAARDATAWLAEDKRKAMLADIGIGTIDQAVLGVHPEKFQSLRLMGLARKILILDEVHAYDAYMTEQIETLLRFQATLGGSAILLSATLSIEQRARFSAAFGGSIAASTATATRAADLAFPMLTSIDARAITTRAIDAAPSAPRRVAIETLATAVATTRTIELARAGACVCRLLNTVGDALDAATEIKAVAPDLPVTVFHARFAMADRLAIETAILDRFGKSGSAAGRRGQIVVATQVVEQSLDIDFDEMVTDLAPIDLLIQRAGRVHRHFRLDRAGSTRLHVVQPEWTSAPDAGWFARAFPSAAFVYKDHAALWRTARLLHDEGALDLPGRLRTLIEGVFGADAEVPPGLRGAADGAEGAVYGDRATARTVVLTPDGGYVPGRIWTPDNEVATRLGDPQVTLRLARRTATGVESWARDEDPWRAWLLSQVRVRRSQVTAVPEDAGTEALRAQWPDGDDPNMLPIVLVEGPAGVWRGEGRRERTPVKILYDAASGLRVLRND